MQISDRAGDLFDTTFDTAVATTAVYAWRTIDVGCVAPGSSTTATFSNRQHSVTRFALTDGVGVQVVPEPAAWLLMAGGLGLIGAAARRRRG